MASSTDVPRRARDPADPQIDPPDAPFLRAVARRWWLVLLPALTLLAAAVAVGLLRAPSYTATTQSNVGSIDVQTQAIPGFVEGAKSLASAYSRIVVSDAIVGPTARQFETSEATVRKRLTSTPVPSSQIVTVKATGPSRQEAIGLANVATEQLGSYVKGLEGASSRSASLLAEYRRRIGSANRLDSEYARLRLQRSGDAQAVPRARLIELKTRADTDRLRAQTLGQLYSDARSKDDAAAEIRLLNKATTATSDRGSVLQRLAFVGFFGGAAVGLGLVALKESQRRRRLHLP